MVFYEKPFFKVRTPSRNLFVFLLPPWSFFFPAQYAAVAERKILFLRRSLMRFLREIDPHWGGEDTPRKRTSAPRKSLLATRLGMRSLFSAHHLSHAASAFSLLLFPDALILTADGVGEWATTTVARGEGNRIPLPERIYSNT